MKLSLTRWYAWFVLAAIMVAGLVPGFLLSHSGKISSAHAAGNTTPTITPSKTVIHAFQTIKITAQGFAPNETVEVYFYYDPHVPPDGFLTCDGSGNCSGTAEAANLTTGGPYMLTGVGSVSGLQAQTNVTLIAGMQLSPSKGGAGTSIQVTGSCFALNETVKIYWGGANGTFLGTASTDNISGNWYFTLNAPAGLTAGKYAIVAVRSHQKPGKVMAWFQYVVANGSYVVPPPQVAFVAQ